MKYALLTEIRGELERMGNDAGLTPSWNKPKSDKDTEKNAVEIIGF